MIKTLLLTTSLLASTNAVAEEKDMASCEDIAAVAESIMKNRQAGVPATKMIELTKDTPLFKTLTVMAYERTRYTTDEVQQRIIRDFTDDIYLECLTARDNDE